MAQAGLDPLAARLWFESVGETHGPLSTASDARVPCPTAKCTCTSFSAATFCCRRGCGVAMYAQTVGCSTAPRPVLPNPTPLIDADRSGLLDAKELRQALDIGGLNYSLLQAHLFVRYTPQKCLLLPKVLRIRLWAGGTEYQA